MQQLQVAWHKCLRQVWRIPYRTHCSILRSMNDGLCESHAFMARFSKFALMAIKSKCDVIRYIAEHLLQTKNTFAMNAEHLAQQLHTSTDALVNLGASGLYKMLTCACDTQCKVSKALASVVIELTQIRDNLMNCSLSPEEIVFIIDDICIN